ncbi:MAG: hypothetical protein IPM63_13010 [Acidobacteriota bacterium]|nr:MAG: hypothetical protein IPM63_13010 [Acidobacteriota bacterium]
MRPKRVRQVDSEQKARLDGWKYEKTVRTAEEHPVLETEPVFERPFEAWTSSDFIRETTFGVTGKHTFHAQENLEILREYLNRSINASPSKVGDAAGEREAGKLRGQLRIRLYRSCEANQVQISGCILEVH